MRGLKWAAILVIGLVALLAVALPVSHYLFYLRAKRLLADMQSIELHKSTWADAQVLMRRWGRYGNYNGSCTAESCRYSIDTGDPFGTIATWMFSHFSAKQMEHIPIKRMGGIVNAMGDLGETLVGKFIVQDGLIVRSGVYAVVRVSPLRNSDDRYGYELIGSAYSGEHVATWADLHNLRKRPFSTHPEFSVSRPSGCENCYAGWIVYSHAAPHSKASGLMAVNLECFKIRSHCEFIEDLLPAAQGFDLYHRLSESAATGKPEACDVPIWARARDAFRVVAARDLRVERLSEGELSGENDTIQVVQPLKGEVPAKGAILTVRPWDPSSDQTVGIAEHIPLGQRVLLFDFDRPEEPPSAGQRAEHFELDRCSVISDTAEARAEIATGMAMNDHLRGPELGDSIWGF